MAEGQRERAAELERVLRAVGQVRHELNNSLTAMLAEIQLLLMDPGHLTMQQRRGLEAIEGIARRMRDRVSSLRELEGA